MPQEKFPPSPLVKGEEDPQMTINFPGKKEKRPSNNRSLPLKLNIQPSS